MSLLVFPSRIGFGRWRWSVHETSQRSPLLDWLWLHMWTKILMDKTAVFWTAMVFFFRGKCTISQFPLIKSHQNHHFTELPPNGLLEHHHVVRWFFPLKYPFSPFSIVYCVFPWFSHGFPMVFPWFIVDFPAMFDQHRAPVFPPVFHLSEATGQLQGFHVTQFAKLCSPEVLQCGAPSR